MKNYFVYILASGKNGTLYVGITSNLSRRLEQHRSGEAEGFTNKYRVYSLVHVEAYPTPEEAIVREKRIKKWNREWKLNLIEKTNPNWQDISDRLLV